MLNNHSAELVVNAREAPRQRFTSGEFDRSGGHTAELSVSEQFYYAVPCVFASTVNSEDSHVGKVYRGRGKRPYPNFAVWNAKPGGMALYPPVPLRVTICGLSFALNLIVSFPLTVPLTVGENVTLIEHVALLAKLVPQVDEETANGDAV